MLTDVVANQWVEKVIDATNMDFSDSSIDIIIASHAIHHLYNPAKFFKECKRVLKNNGLILICEVNTSLFMRIIIKIMKQEGYSYDVDVFSDHSICNDKDDILSGNNAIPEMLFEDENQFSEYFNGLTIEYQKLDEFMIFPLSQLFFYQIKYFNSKNPNVCLKIFKSNNYFGLLVLLNIFIGKTF